MVKVNATMIGLLVALTLFPLFPTLASSTDNWQLALNWEYSNGGGDLVVSEGYVCFFSAQNYYGSASLVAVNASTGHGIWSIQTNGNALGDTPVIMNGLVYTSTSAYNLTDSQLVLNYSNYRGYGSPKIANGVLLITTSDATNGFGPDGLVALNSLTGSQLWRFNEGRNVGGGSGHMIGFENQPPAVTNGIAYFSCASGIYAFNIQTGSQLWHQSIYAFGGIIEAGHGNVYVSLSGHYRNGTIFYKVYCMNAASGSTKWSYQTEKMETIAIGDNALYISGVALDANTGKIRWNNSLLESCSVAQGVVFSASKNSIFALNASTGQAMANYTFPNSENPVSITANDENIFATISRGYEEPMSVQSLTFQKESELFTGQLFASWTITAVLVGVVVIAILCLIGILLFLRKIKKANTR